MRRFHCEFSSYHAAFPVISANYYSDHSMMLLACIFPDNVTSHGISAIHFCPAWVFPIVVHLELCPSILIFAVSLIKNIYVANQPWPGIFFAIHSVINIDRIFPSARNPVQCACLIFGFHCSSCDNRAFHPKLIAVAIVQLSLRLFQHTTREYDDHTYGPKNNRKHKHHKHNCSRMALLFDFNSSRISLVVMAHFMNPPSFPSAGIWRSYIFQFFLQFPDTLLELGNFFAKPLLFFPLKEPQAGQRLPQFS